MKKAFSALFGAIIIALAVIVIGTFLNAESPESRQETESHRAREDALAAVLPPPSATATQPTIPPSTSAADPTDPPATPASVPPTEAPATTEAPVVTTTPVPTTLMPPHVDPADPCGAEARAFRRPDLVVNEGFAWVTIPALGNTDPMVLARANESDFGQQALDGTLAWAPSSHFVNCPDPVPANNLSLPGEGGVVVIGGHRTSHLKPFANLQNLRMGDWIEVVTGYGTFTYEVSAPCDDANQASCSLPGDRLLVELAQRQTEVETLYLFTCESGTRLFVQAKLVSAASN